MTTLTFFKFETFASKFWALSMMQRAIPQLKNERSHEFFKLLGTGSRNGFSVVPDWSTYALLQTWPNERTADEFFKSSSLIQSYKTRATCISTLYMRSAKSKGAWNGINPFERKEVEVTPSDPVAVITRATIAPRRMLDFWKHIPQSETGLVEEKGLLLKKGIGEYPVFQMATFSCWKDESSMMDYAYRSEGHASVIKLAKQRGWFSEDLFARFVPFRCEGQWEGRRGILDLS